MKPYNDPIAAPISSKCRLAIIYAREIRDKTKAYVELAREESQKAASRLFEQTKIEALNCGRMESAKLFLEAQIAKQQALEDSRSEMINLVLGVVKELVAEIPLNYPETITLRLSRALAKLKLTYQAIIKVNPGDLDYVKRWASDFSNQQQQLFFTVKEDSSIARGDAIIETEYGQVHSSLTLHLQAIASVLSPQVHG